MDTIHQPPDIPPDPPPPVTPYFQSRRAALDLAAAARDLPPEPWAA
jgi:hypothetical protein